MRMPSYANTELNPTLELARRITAFNYRNGKIPQRMSRMFAIWSNLDLKKDEPPKVGFVFNYSQVPNRRGVGKSNSGGFKLEYSGWKFSKKMAY